MKKLLLLAVVILGFAVTSFAQHVSGPLPIIIPNIQAPAAISPNLQLIPAQPMSFGTITNVKNGGTIHLTPAGVVTTTNGIKVDNGSQPAIFFIQNATLTPVVSLPTYYFPFNGGKLDIAQATDCSMTLDGGTSTNFTYKIGGTITLYDGATGAFTINGLTISVNNQ